VSKVKPTHRLCLGVTDDKGGITWRNVGVAWINDANGSFNVALDECVLLSQRDIAQSGDKLMLFRKDHK
jgi:hypothetical protein